MIGAQGDSQSERDLLIKPNVVLSCAQMKSSPVRAAAKQELRRNYVWRRQTRKK